MIRILDYHVRARSDTNQWVVSTVHASVLTITIVNIKSNQVCMYRWTIIHRFYRAKPTMLQKIIYVVSVIQRVKVMTKQHREYKILHQNIFRAHKNLPPLNALYNTMQMVMVDSCDNLIISFLWLSKGGKHNYILLLHQFKVYCWKFIVWLHQMTSIFHFWLRLPSPFPFP